MNRNYGIWCTILAILVIGIGTTSYTNRLVKSQATGASETTASATEAVALSLAESGTEADTSEEKTEPETAAMRSAQIPMEDSAPKEAGVEETVLSPLETAPAAARIESGAAAAVPSPYPAQGIPESTEIGGYEQYEARLAELDAQIKRMREEETDSNPNSIKTTAETELKLWDAELNLLYNEIMDELDEDSASELIKQEREWMRERDALAVAAAKKSGGTALEGLEYTASLADTTRKRVYDLAASYKDVLDN